MYRMALALMISLALTSCSYLTGVTKGATLTLVIPSEYLERCPRNLPELKEASKEALQENRKETQLQYHRCVDKDDALIYELLKQGVKGTKDVK